MTCPYCNEPVMPGENEPFYPPSHPECVFRDIAGSVAHLQRRCSCYVRGSTEGDPPGMTHRQAAIAALILYRQMVRLGVDPFGKRRIS